MFIETEWVRNLDHLILYITDILLFFFLVRQGLALEIGVKKCVSRSDVIYQESNAHGKDSDWLISKTKESVSSQNDLSSQINFHFISCN